MTLEPLPPPQRPRLLQWFVSAAVAAGLVALALSVKNAVDLDEQADARERDRVETDLASCELGNELRAQVQDVGAAAEALVDGILNVATAAREGDPRTVAFLEQLDPLFEEYERALAEIEMTDCQAVVQGA